MKATLFALLLVVTWSMSPAQPKGNYSRRFSQPPVDQEKGKEVLATFRGQRLHGDFVFLFEMTSLPRRRGAGEKISYRGRLWGRWQEGRLLSRFLIRQQIPAGYEKMASAIDTDAYTAFLMRSGDNTRIWKYASPGAEWISELQGAEIFEPLLPGLELSAFDLQMAFIFWPEYRYEGVSAAHRTVHRFLMQPPADLQGKPANLKQVRFFIESRFRALTKVEMLNAQNEPFKTLRVRKFKKVDGRYIVKEVDFFDERTRRKTRFSVVNAVFNPKLPTDFFTPEALSDLPVIRNR